MSRPLRAELIDRIAALSDEEVERVAPWLEADLALVDEIDALRAEIARGRESARTEPLVDDEDVVAEALSLLPRRA